jgi:hypothetical protein
MKTMKTMKNENLGSAQINLKLENNILWVYNGDGTLLHKRRATPETWDTLWKVIRSNI